MYNGGVTYSGYTENANCEDVVTYLYDIVMDEELPDYLQLL